MSFSENTNKTQINLFWFRRDLRLEDNTGLFYALSKGNVLPIFIFDTNIIESLPETDARVHFIHKQLEKIHSKLNTFNSDLAVFKGKPIDVFSELIASHTINAVYTNHDYEPYAIERDNVIKTLLAKHNIDFCTFKDQVIFECNEIMKDDGLPYKVYTPYSKKWLATYEKISKNRFPSEKFKNTYASHNHPFLSLNDIGFKPNKTNPIIDFKLSKQLINDYEATRNFPALDSTTRLGPHLRFGAVSIRFIANKAFQQSNITFLKELIWREFFMQILWHFPYTVTRSFKPQYDAIKWRNNKKEFQQWCLGNTGYPLVDAGMRELNATGFIHNRVRMLVGSFLCKHLLIDWRWGEAYFAEKLYDYEMASNIGNWQWVAGCGVDASPYFRIFNPTTQVQKFDKQHQYIKKWVPEYQEINYINSQVIGHKIARERCLKTYKEALT